MKRINLNSVPALALKYSNTCVMNALAQELGRCNSPRISEQLVAHGFSANYVFGTMSGFDGRCYDWKFSYPNYEPDSLEAKLGFADGTAARKIWKEV